jgi:(p)ppGpp synthase/HD superfamily hydrolase
MNVIQEAAQYAKAAHDSIGQKRKYTGEPYYLHCERVAYLVSLVTDDANMIAAAWLHDVLEDVMPLNHEYCNTNLLVKFGNDIHNLVMELTEITTHADGNRAERKAIERARLGNASSRAKTIKLADLIDNTKDICEHDLNFAKVYLAEKELLLPYLALGDRKLHILADKLLVRHQTKIVHESLK